MCGERPNAKGRTVAETSSARSWASELARDSRLAGFSRLSIGKMVKSLRLTMPNFRCSCRNSRITSRVTADSLRSQTPPNGSRLRTRMAARVSAKRTPCRSGQVPAGITSAISMLATATPSSQRNLKSTGCRWTSMWVVPNTPCFTCSTAVSGTRSCSTSASSLPTNRSRSSSTRA